MISLDFFQYGTELRTYLREATPRAAQNPGTA
jgi:hypothetical protein